MRWKIVYNNNESEVSIMDDLKQDLGLEQDAIIPPDYPISYFVHESDINRMDMSHRRVEKWLIILCFTLLIALIGTNVGWIIYESQFEDVTTTVTQETNSEGGGDAIIHGENAGAVFYGESKANSDSQDQTKEN